MFKSFSTLENQLFIGKTQPTNVCKKRKRYTRGPHMVSVEKEIKINEFATQYHIKPNLIRN